MSLLTCPKCGRRFSAERSPALPFCSERCRMLDLHGWLNEQYGLPYEREDAAEDAPERSAPEDDG